MMEKANPTKETLMVTHGDPDDASSTVALLPTDRFSSMPAWSEALEARLYELVACGWREVTCVGYQRSGAGFQSLSNGDRAAVNAYHFPTASSGPFSLGIHDAAGQLILVGEVVGYPLPGAVQVPSFGARLAFGETRHVSSTSYVTNGLAHASRQTAAPTGGDFSWKPGLRVWVDGVRTR